MRGEDADRPQAVKPGAGHRHIRCPGEDERQPTTGGRRVRRRPVEGFQRPAHLRLPIRRPFLICRRHETYKLACGCAGGGS